MYNSETGAVGLMLSRIRESREMHRLDSMHLAVVNVGQFYYVQHWHTKIAVGLRGELPFAMTTQGWNTVTTLNILRSLGFNLVTKRISLGMQRNPVTHRMNNIFKRVLHIDGKPMLDNKGNVDYWSWYGRGGIRLDANPDFS